MEAFAELLSTKRPAAAADPAAHPAKARRVESAVVVAQSVGELLQEADAFDVEELDAASLKCSLLALEKKVSRNQLMRAKHFDKPERFVDSEVELDDAIKALHILATAPELYPLVARLKGSTTLLGLLTHENSDVAIDVVELLHELCDPDVVGEDRASALTLVDALLDGGLIDLLMQNLHRLDEAVEEEATGVHNTMGILESLLELRPTLALAIVEAEGAVAWLLQRVRVKPSAAAPAANRLYVAEILSILVQSGGGAARRALGKERDGVDGIDALLQCAAHWQRRNPVDAEEEECASNVFSVLTQLLLEPEFRARFRRLEGLELVVRMLANNGYSFHPALRVADYALAGARLSCERAVDVGILKHLFPAFMGRGAKSRRKRFKVDHAEVDKHAISIVATLCRELESGGRASASGSASGAAGGQHRARVLRKFLEKDLAKTDRTMELFAHYLERVEACAAPDAPEDARAAAQYDEASEMGLYLLRRVDAGLLSLTRLAEVAVYAGAAHAQIRSRVHAKLRESRRGSDAIASVLDGAFAF